MTTPSRLLAGLFLLAPFAACAEGDTSLTPSDDGGPTVDASIDGPRPGTSSSSGGSSSSSSGNPEVPPCGNGTLDSGEQCDDGNIMPGDGCSPTCQRETSGPGDHCSNAIAVPLTQTGSTLRATIAGSTAGAYNQYGSGCGGGSGADVAYTFTPSTSGKAVLTFEADFLGIVSARSQCEDSLSEVGCIGIETLGETRTLEVPVFAGSPTTLFVDGFAGASGNFTIDVNISLAACGNGVAELPERCDDGNLVDGDGCNAVCELEVGGVLDNCPGQPFMMSAPEGAPRVISVAGNTLTDGGNTTQAEYPLTVGSGNQVFYGILPDIDGSAHASLNAGYRLSALSARSECPSVSYQLAGTARVDAGESSIDFPVRAGEWFYLMVDGDRTQGGPFSATVTVTPGACGNDRFDSGEGCDDGNLIDGDGCSATCQVEANVDANTCDGAVLALTEDADGHQRARVAGNTIALDDKVTRCSSNILGKGRDAVYRVQPTMDGALTARLLDGFSGTVAIYAAMPCVVDADAGAPDAGDLDAGDAGPTAPPAALACSYRSFTPDEFLASEPYQIRGLTGLKEVNAPVLAGRTYYVVVDSYMVSSGNDVSTIPQAAGPFNLALDVSPSVCGNGLVDGNEECDDGNTRSGDTCSATCSNEPSTDRDTCATAEVLALEQGEPGHYATSVLRSTRFATDNNDFNVDNCEGEGPDVYFKVVAPAGGILRARAASENFDVLLGLRDSQCSLSSRPLVCSNEGPTSVTETASLSVDAGEEIYVVVDSMALAAYAGCVPKFYTPPSPPWKPAEYCDSLLPRGLFDLEVSITPSVCGDGYLVADVEQCDDGNLVSGDGCSATCEVEQLADVDRCPGHLLTLQQQGPARYRGVIAMTTNGLTADYAGFCGGNAAEGVIRVQSPVDGVLRAVATNMNNVTVYAREVCTDPNTEFRKSSSATCLNVAHDTVSFQVVAGDEYYLFVDGLQGATGAPTLEVIVTGTTP